MMGKEAARLFVEQLRRRTLQKVVFLPSPLKEPGPHISVAIRKIVVPKKPRAAAAEHEVRLYVTMEGKVESETGRDMAVDLCESLSTYLDSATRLEDADGNQIANTRITATVNEDDGILGDPDDDKVAWIDDLHYVTIAYPAD
jgi:hypothetical protein